MQASGDVEESIQQPQNQAAADLPPAGFGQLKIRDEPLRIGCAGAGEHGHQNSELIGPVAVAEEMRDDPIKLMGRRRQKLD